MKSENFLRTGEAAMFLRVSVATLARWRSQGVGPNYIKYGGKIIVYRQSDLEEWLRENRISVDSE